MDRLAALVALLAGGCHAPVAAEPPRHVDGVIVDQVGGQRLADVMVCGYDDATPPDCVQSDASGAYVVDVPASAAALVSYRKSGYVPSLVEYHALDATTHLAMQALLGSGAVAHLSASAQIAIDADKPMLIVEIAVRTPGTQLIAPAELGGDGPFYFDENGNPAGAGATTLLAAWFNATPGTYEASVRDQAGVCPPGRYAWSGAAAGTMRVRLVDGMATRLIIDCNM